jgi:hypothetical protein
LSQSLSSRFQDAEGSHLKQKVEAVN